MLIYQAQSSRITAFFTDVNAATLWVERNASYSPLTAPYWKRISPDCEVLCSGISGFQIGTLYEVELDTSGDPDPLRDLAFKILAGDPMALDLARDVIRC